MKCMSEEQRQLAVDHLDLVDKVIRSRIHVPNLPTMNYDDFYQAGCEGLCHAALQYQPELGDFNGLAWTSILNAIVDCTRREAVRREEPWSSCMEEYSDPDDIQAPEWEVDPEHALRAEAVMVSLRQHRDRNQGNLRMGLDAIYRTCQGENLSRVAEEYRMNPKKVRYWMTRGREYLQKDPLLYPQRQKSA